MGKIIAAVALILVGLAVPAGIYFHRARQANVHVQALADRVCQAASVGEPVTPVLALGTKLGGNVSHSSGRAIVSFRVPGSDTVQCLIGLDGSRVAWANAVERGD